MRKSHSGRRFEQSTQVAALVFSLIGSAKLAGMEPHAHLREPTPRTVRNPDTLTLARVKSPEF